MTLVEDNETGGFSFIWRIENFGYCSPQDDSIESPPFAVKSIGNFKWCLRLFLRGGYEAGSMSYYLDIISNAKTIYCGVNYALSIRVTDGSFKKIQNKNFNSDGTKHQGFRRFLKLKELRKTGTGGYIDDEDTLTLRCRIWTTDRSLLASVKCFARTKISVENIVFVWSFEKFGTLPNETSATAMHPTSSEILPFTVNLLSGGTFGDSTEIQAIIKQVDTVKWNLLRCELSLLGSNGEVRHTVREEHWFKTCSGTQVWIFPFISKNKLFADEKRYLPDGSLCVRFQFAVSSGIRLNEIHRTEYGMEKHIEMESSSQLSPVSLNGCLQRLYEDEKFSDFSVRTKGMKFAVHKAVLSARSAVFSAMFERDVKENQLGFVEIEDLDDFTVSRMLLFIYTDNVEDLDVSMAVKLYFAADKYEIEALKIKCSTFLKDNIGVSNVCDILILGDMHQDKKLKSFAQEYVVDYSKEIMNSEAWKKLMMEKPSLASETMHYLITRN